MIVQGLGLTYFYETQVAKLNSKIIELGDNSLFENNIKLVIEANSRLKVERDLHNSNSVLSKNLQKLQLGFQKSLFEKY